MMKLRLNWVITGAILAGLLLFSLGLFLAQDNIIRFAMNPRMPYDTYTPPPAPDYERPSSWLLYPQNVEEAPAAVFYVHSTTYRSAEEWNAPLLDKKSGSLLSRISVPNEAGPFRDLKAVFAPRYRQATLSAFFTLKYQGRAARLTAYEDVSRAFGVFLGSVPEDKPIVLVGYGQGGLHVQGLLMDYFQNNELLRRRLVVAYIIDSATPVDLFDGPLANTPICQNATDIRCVVSWSSYTEKFSDEMRRLRDRSLVFAGKRRFSESKGRPLLCVNPLDWSQEEEAKSMTAHLGAASATGLHYEDEPAIIKNIVTARCENGVAIVNQTAKRYLRRPRYFGKKWAPLTYNLFYEDIRQNAQDRLGAWQAVWSEEERHAPPILQIEDIEDAPIKKVPG